MTIYNRIFIIAGLVVGLTGLEGCDKVSTLVDYFAPKDKTAKPAPSATESVAVAQAQTVPPSAQPEVMAPNVLAKVGDWSITIEEFKERLNALKEIIPEYDVNDVQSNALVLEELLRQELLVQAAKKTGLDKDKDINLAVEEFRKTLLVREMAAKLTEGIVVTEEEARKYYDDNPQEFVAPGQWRVREIVMETEAAAKAILLELYKGEGPSFEEVATNSSKSLSASKGGDLGFISIFPFPRMEASVATLEVGDISNVFKGPDGYYIVKLEQKQGGEIQEYEPIKEDIIEGLTIINQQQAVLKYLDKLRRDTKIDVNIDLLEEQE